MKNVLLAIVGLAFALGFTSGDEESKKREQMKQQQLIAKQIEKEKHERRW